MTEEVRTPDGEIIHVEPWEEPYWLFHGGKEPVSITWLLAAIVVSWIGLGLLIRLWRGST